MTTPNHTRLPNGKAMAPPNDTVAADLIGLVAGVSGGAVVKVMLALNAISETTGLTYEELLDRTAIPTEAASGRRFHATEDMADKLADHPAMESYEDELLFLRRRRRGNMAPRRVN